MRYISLENLFKVIEWITVILLTAMVVVVGIQVGSRLVLNRTPGWSEELAQVLTIWFGFLGAAVLVRTQGHIALEFLVNRLPNLGQKIAQVIVTIFMTGFAVYLIYWGGLLVNHFWGQDLPGTGLAVGISYLPIPISGILIILALVYNVIDKFQTSECEE